MKLSILVNMLPSRFDLSVPLLTSLNKQIEDNKATQNVEILGLLDNKNMTVGEKRNYLLMLAKGDYITFVDDDDRVADFYIEKILEALKTPVDLVLFPHLLTYVITKKNMGKHILCEYDLSYKKGEDYAPGRYRGPPAHTHVWRYGVARCAMFEERNYQEDSHWVSEIAGHVKSVYKLEEVLYFYDFNSNRTETRS